VRHHLEGYEGTVDGLTAIVARVPDLSSDQKTQYRAYVGYRVDVGTYQRKLAAEEDLLMFTDLEGLIRMGRVNVAHRRRVTAQLRRVFTEDRFTK
jgi:hypothetical protein